ncbi:MAG TPA: sterol desaturase family protein [Edaphocola sp.]|nr:sterol desaturase family protein [Edaphocola sp.]
MEIDKIKNKGQARLFKSEYMEMMTKTHPIVIYSMYFPVIFFLPYYGHFFQELSWGRIAWVFIAGIFVWTFLEYILHRFVFHMTSENPRIKRIAYTMHGVHHEYPRDRERLFMPPIPSIIAASLFFCLFYLIMGWNALAFFPGFMLGYISYGSMHYAIHAFKPPHWLKALWRNHHLHHYKYPELGFGVSSVLWDHVFRTIPPKK